jgi:hypothetical protein
MELSALVADITTLDTDAIVNAANDSIRRKWSAYIGNSLGDRLRFRG